MVSYVDNYLPTQEGLNDSVANFAEDSKVIVRYLLVFDIQNKDDTNV